MLNVYSLQDDNAQGCHSAFSNCSTAMSRATRYLKNFALAMSFWAILCYRRDQLIPKEQHFFLLAAPIIALTIFGIYACLNILYHLAIFKECPEAFAELQKEIVQAKAELKEKGIRVD